MPFFKQIKSIELTLIALACSNDNNFFLEIAKALWSNFSILRIKPSSFTNNKTHAYSLIYKHLSGKSL